MASGRTFLDRFLSEARGLESVDSLVRVEIALVKGDACLGTADCELDWVEVCTFLIWSKSCSSETNFRPQGAPFSVQLHVISLGTIS